MAYYVYMLLSKRKGKLVSYVGYSSNLINRLSQHNNSKGAKFTRGSLWKIIYQKKYTDKKTAMRDEYKLKKKLKDNFINK
jgi:putative endonuclease